jgi:hypothetical protein
MSAHNTDTSNVISVNTIPTAADRRMVLMISSTFYGSIHPSILTMFCRTSPTRAGMC